MCVRVCEGVRTSDDLLCFGHRYTHTHTHTHFKLRVIYCTSAREREGDVTDMGLEGMGSILLILTQTSKNGRSKRRNNADAVADWFKTRSGWNWSEWNSAGLLVSATGRKMRWWGGSGMYLSWFVPNAVSTTPQCGKRFVPSKKRLSVHPLSLSRPLWPTCVAKTHLANTSWLTSV